MTYLLFFSLLWRLPWAPADLFTPSFSDRVWPGELTVEAPTLHCAGFEWAIRGDANRNAAVAVRFRKKGAEAWSEAQPLLRLGGEKVYGHEQRWLYEVPAMFAGSIFGLEEDTEYECRFEMQDPDGVEGQPLETVLIRTRGEPRPWPHGRVFHVYPPGYQGPKEEPAFTGLNEAYYGKGNLGDWWLVPEPRVRPGDVLLVHAGTYRGDLLDYVDPLALQFHGAYVFTQQGTPERPIVIKAAGDGEVVFDGAGAYRLFDVMAGDYHYFEGLTIRNTQVAFYAGLKHVKGGSGLTVKNCRIEDVGIAVMTHSAESKNFYIADNVMIGRHDPDTLHGWYGFENPTPLSSYYAVKVYGQGHVICHNDISFFHDGVCVDTHGLPEEGPGRRCASIDIYRNDLFNMSDDFIEADGGVHNIRVFENRGFNAYHAGLSAQPVFGGPVYFLRNIIYQVPGTSLKFTIRPAGIFLYHNTICAETAFVGASNFHFRNNLFLGPDPQRPLLSATNFTAYSTLDYNAYARKDRPVFQWRYPPADSLNHADAAELPSAAVEGLEGFRALTGQERHGRLVDYGIFRQVTPPDPARRGHVYSREGYDFRLRPEAPVVDAGQRLPNINDGFRGAAPDLGALEAGEERGTYGPRRL